MRERRDEGERWDGGVGKRTVVEGESTRSGKVLWREAQRWRRRVEGALLASGLTFREWLVLDAIRFLVQETGDAINQNQIAALLELDRRAISDLMKLLEKKWLVSRGPAMNCRDWRVFISEDAGMLLSDLEKGIELASAGC
jgi:DNA-binding MarR family transcriptional regulator